MKIGLIGLGSWSQKIIRYLPNSQDLFAVLTSREDASANLPKRTIICRSYDEFTALGLDRIIIANEASKHLQTLKKIRTILPIIPILLEKPFVMSSAEVDEYFDFFGKDNNLLVNHTLLFNKSLLEIKKSHKQTSPLKIFCTDCNLGPYRADCSALWDYGPHPISVAIYLAADEDLPIDIKILEAHVSKTIYGEIVTFRLTIQNRTEVICSVGNGSPVKIRKYLMHYPNEEIIEFDGMSSVNPQPLQILLAEFNEFKVEQTENRDSRWGLNIPSQVIRAISGLELFVK